MPIDWEFNGAGADRRRWRNLVTGEYRLQAPVPGELDWVECTSATLCPD
jgi:hypothetical protein